MSKQKRSYEMNMCEGPLVGKMLVFTIPLMFSGILQLLFNAADTIVVGRYAGSEALAAVGSTTALINLLVNLFMGLSVGANILISRYYGAKRETDIQETVHTSITVAALAGILLAVLGNVFAKPLLLLMGSPEDVVDLAAIYVKIYFMGMPVILIYNYGSAILRAIGDTKRPLYYLTIAGVVNVVLNLIFVIGFDMSVAGVALATILAQCVSVALLMRCMCKMEGSCRLEFKKLGIHKEKALLLLKYGLPAGLQGSVFSFSNVLIQSSINSFGSVAMAGSSAAANIEGFIYVAMNSFQQTALCFTSQNLGGGKYERISKVLRNSVIMVAIVGILMGGGCYFFGEQLLHVYSTDPAVISYGLTRFRWIGIPYFLCGIMDAMVGMLRGLGYAVVPMVVSIIGACGFRVVWILTVFARFHSLDVLFASYVISWILTGGTHMICFAVVWRKLKKKLMT
ncbi:MAG: MATE family efflux transporter [Lachnospiraceae bacterium]|nr:MATE family efflux transporter [Lachnospiraceae bacterium]